jgi:hypothetical protein
MFPIAVITDEISQDLSVAAALVKEFGGEGATRLCLQSLHALLAQV